MRELDDVPYGESVEREANPPQRLFELLACLIAVVGGRDKPPERDLEKRRPVRVLKPIERYCSQRRVLCH